MTMSVKEIDFEDLARRMRTREPNARRCWEIWVETRSSNFAARGRTAYQNRMRHFQEVSGLTNGAVVRFCRVLALLEQQLYPEHAAEGAPAT
jgi:citrate lyase beta subunit